MLSRRPSKLDSILIGNHAKVSISTTTLCDLKINMDKNCLEYSFMGTFLVQELFDVFDGS